MSLRKWTAEQGVREIVKRKYFFVMKDRKLWKAIIVYVLKGNEMDRRSLQNLERKIFYTDHFYKISKMNNQYNNI